MTKVNRVTVAVVDGEAKISLYKTNTKLAEFTNDDIEVPYLEESEITQTVYQQYCKELVINLLQNGGIEGYYYEEKQKSDDVNVGRKFGSGEFGKAIQTKLEDMLTEWEIPHKITIEESKTLERYKGDSMVKNGTVEFNINLDGRKYIKVFGEIKSGQLCKPKSFDYLDTTYALNITNIKKILHN